ncbi:MAG: hypothetical protein ABSE63_05590 [Thermoguttaceae bacterium]|jgi:NAD-dependent SIR2 family protein deacetylase
MSTWDHNSISVILLGAGFSAAATDGKLPLMCSFFDFLDQKYEPALFEFISCVAKDFRKANVEKVLILLEQINTSPDALLEGWGEKWKKDAPLLRRELLFYILRRLKQAVGIHRDNWAAKFLAGTGPATTIISMNYDNIAERILSYIAHSVMNRACPHCKMSQLLQKACSCSGREQIIERDWRGSLIKLHGSIAWRRCVNTKCCNYECLVADKQCRPFEPHACPHCLQSCEPVMIMPTMSKHLDEIREISTMWNAARMAIADAESIVIFGFSMPTSDMLLIEMLRSAIHASRMLRRVAVIDLDPDSVMERFEQCIPNDLKVEYSPFMVTPGISPDWFVTT